MKQFYSFFVCAAAILLVFPSCVQWNIGERIREAGQRHTGGDICHPVDGKVYSIPTPGVNNSKDYFVMAQEVTYRRRPPLFSNDYDLFWGALGVACAPEEAVDVQPTGRIIAAAISCDGDMVPRSFKKQVNAIPAFATAMPVGNMVSLETKSPFDYGSISHTEASTTRKLAAAPFDYVVDPILTAGHSTLTAAGLIVTSPIWLTMLLLGAR